MSERKSLNFFVDAFEVYTYVGDTVAYVVGDKTWKRMVKGVVKDIYTTPGHYSDKLTVEIECVYDSRKGATVPRRSKLNHGERIMSLSPYMVPKFHLPS